MPFDVTRHDQQDPFRPAFHAGLWFCLLSPTLLLPVLNFLTGALGYTMWLSDPWNMFGPGATLNDAPLRDLQTRTLREWAPRLAPAILCAAFWCILHFRRTRLVSPWLFIPVALIVPLVIALIAVPIAAYEFDPRARATFDWAVKWLRQDKAGLDAWPGFAQMFVVFLQRSFAWASNSLNLNAPRPTLLLTAVQIHLVLVPATWVFARAVLAYATSRNANTLPAVARAAGADIREGFYGAVRRTVWLSGLNDQGTPSVGERIARAVAAPWLIPAACALMFIVLNKVINLFPLALALLVLVAYAVAVLAWRYAERLNITSYRLGGAVVGLICAILAMMICSLTSIQSWVFVLQAGGTPKYALLVSYLPPYIATIISLGLGLRLGWRSAVLTPPPSAASPLA